MGSACSAQQRKHGKHDTSSKRNKNRKHQESKPEHQLNTNGQLTTTAAADLDASGGSRLHQLVKSSTTVNTVAAYVVEQEAEHSGERSSLPPRREDMPAAMKSNKAHQQQQPATQQHKSSGAQHNGTSNQPCKSVSPDTPKAVVGSSFTQEDLNTLPATGGGSPTCSPKLVHRVQNWMQDIR